MVRRIVLSGAAPAGAWLVLFVPGMALIALGVAIAVWPQLLVAMVAGVFILLGVVIASIGWRLRSGAGMLGNFTRPPGGDGPFGQM